VELTLVLAVASQAVGIILGIFAALGRLSTFRLGPHFVFVAICSVVGGLLAHPVLSGEFNAWWRTHFGPNPPGGAETWLSIVLIGFGILWFIVGTYGTFIAAAPRWSQKIARPRFLPFRSITGIYVWLFRGTPLLVQLFFVFFAIPQMTNRGLIFDAATSAFIGLSLNEGAYMAEIVRAGIASVDAGQMEAAQSLGMTRALAMRRIVLPQAIRIIIPPTGNEFISMLKNPSLAYSIGATELFYQTQLIATSGIGLGSQHFFELAAVAATWYLVLTSVFSYFQGHIEHHYERGVSREIRGPTMLQRATGSLISRPVRDRPRGGPVRV